MNSPSDSQDTTAHDLRRASLRWLEWFFFLLFITLAVWQLFRWWAILPWVIAGLILVRSINTNRVANLLDRR